MLITILLTFFSILDCFMLPRLLFFISFVFIPVNTTTPSTQSVFTSDAPCNNKLFSSSGMLTFPSRNRP